MSDSPGNTTQTMEIAQLDTQRLPLSEVTAHPQNPRTHSDRQIKELQASLTEHGYAAGSMTVQRSRMRLVKGHGIYEALIGLECVEADFVVVDMDDAEALLFLARDNRLSDLSSFDVPKLKAITVELQKIDVPLERIGFDEGEFKSLESDWAKSEADNRVIEEDDPPEVSADEPITQEGDLWHLGDHKVLCGDSTCAEDAERVMGGEKAVLMATDPPYGISYSEESTGRSRITGNPNKPESYDPIIGDDVELYHAFLSVAVLVLAEDWGGYVFYNSEKSESVYKAFRDLYIKVGQLLIWVKPSPVPSYRKYLYKHEPFLFVGPSSNVKPNGRWFGQPNATTVWEYGRETDRGMHPTMKPVPLVGRMISDMASMGHIVYDPFLGSGTTLIAADQLDRVCYGLEIAPKYCDVIVQRYINHKGNSDDVWVERGTDRITWEQISRKVKVV